MQLAQHPPCNMGCHPPTPAIVNPSAGICHTDYHQVNDEWGGGIFPMVPGHEIVGIVTEVGPKVKSLKPGDRVGVGCFVESCMKCDRYSSLHSVALTSARHHALGADICTLLCLACRGHSLAVAASSSNCRALWRGCLCSGCFCCSFVFFGVLSRKMAQSGSATSSAICRASGRGCRCSGCWCLLA